jgi:hypothetical protein
MYRKGIHNFSKGEIAPVLYGRTDIAPYAAAVRRARNVVVMKYGGLTSRPGTEFVGEALDADNPVKLFSFRFDEGRSGQNYALEMGQGYTRFLSGGGLVVEEVLAVLGATNANPVVVNIPFHGYAVGDRWAVSGVQGMVEINDRVWPVLAVIDADHFSIDADGTGWGVFTGDAAGGATRAVAPPATPADPVVPDPVPPPDPPIVINPGDGGSDGGYGGGGGGGFNNAENVRPF